MPLPALTPSVSHRRCASAAAWGAVALVGLAACGRPAEPDLESVIERSTFVETWIDLRRAAPPGGAPLSEADRARVLAEHGVTSEQLLEFADRHGADVELMKDIWDEIETRLNPGSTPEETDSGGPATTGSPG